MNKQKSKKLNNHQRLITAIALIVVALLAICVTFAWYTNRITTMKGLFTLGKFNYKVTLYDVNYNSSTGKYELGSSTSKNYTNEDADNQTFSGNLTVTNQASNSVKYQVVKVENSSNFGIKAYEYLDFNNDTMKNASSLALANYFYFKPFVLPVSSLDSNTLNSLITSGDYDAADIAAVDSDITFGSMDQNSVALGSDAIEDSSTVYYLLGYCVNNLPPELIESTGVKTVEVTPVIAIGQANGPVPQTTASAKVLYADSWQELKSAIASANEGDTIYITENIEGPARTNLSITKGINLNLNGNNLTIHGDLVFNYKNADSRNLTVPAASNLYVDGDLYVDTLGAFSINGGGSSKNIFLGKNDGGEISGGHFYADCGLSINEGSGSGIKPESVNENSGLIINSVQIQHYEEVEESGVTSVEYKSAVLTLSGSDTMIKVGSGSVLSTVIAPESTSYHDIYVVNYGKITNLSLANVSYSNKDNTVGLYIKNYNTINNTSIPSNAIGYNTSSSNYNTRVINGDGAATTFKDTSYFTPVTSFTVNDVEPINATEQSVVEQVPGVTGAYVVYLRNVSANTSPNYESITALFNTYGFTNYATACTSLKIVTNNAITLKEEQFTNIRDNFGVLNSLDLSSAAIDGGKIPDDAMLNKTSLTDLVLPVTEIDIGDSAFKGTSLTKITLSSNVGDIGTDAFNVSSSNLEVIWDNANQITVDKFSAFDENKTIIFMDASLAAQAMKNASFTDEWKLNIYEFYDFKASSGTYYCKYSRDGSTATGCEIIYFAGALSTKSGTDIVPTTLSDGTASYTVVGVGRQAFRKSIKANGGATTVIVGLENCTSVGDYAFAGTASSRLNVSELKLDTVTSIGENAFAYNTITLSSARSNSFAGMTALGSNAFSYAIINGGILDLHGAADNKYTPADSALTNLTIRGDYAQNSDTGNAVLDLRNIKTVYSTFATGMSCKADLLLSGADEIAANAFRGAVTANDDRDNIIDARNVKKINPSSFYNISCGTFYLGINDATVLSASSPYKSIIGKTASPNIGTLVLDGDFETDGQSAIASVDSASDIVTIGTLNITANVSAISDYAFAAKSVTEHNLVISALSVASGASYTINADAFYGVSFGSGTYTFEGVTTVGAEAFAYSTIVKLNLGSAIKTIKNQNFIKGCDSIQELNLAAVTSDIVVLQNNNEAADPNISSEDTTLSNFTIKTEKAILMDYINDAVWSGWKQYFEAMAHSFDTNVIGTTNLVDGNSVSTPLHFRWYFYVINTSNISYGAQIVGFEYLGDSDDFYNETHFTYKFPQNSVSLDSISIPSAVKIGNLSYKVTEFGGEGINVFEDSNIPATINKVDDPDTLDVDESADNVNNDFKLGIPYSQYFKYFYAESVTLENIVGFRCLQTGQRGSYSTGAASYTYTLDAVDGTSIYENRGTNYKSLIKVAPSYSGSTYTLNYLVETVNENAFSGCVNITGFVIPSNSNLNLIQDNAFKDSNVTTFDFSALTTKVVYLGSKTALGEVRKRTIDSNGYFTYVVYDSNAAPIKIYVPSSVSVTIGGTTTTYYYTSLSDYYLYNVNQCIVTGSSGLSVNDTTANTKAATSKLALKKSEFDQTLSGINYHLMNSGTVYDGVEYKSDTSEFIAVVTGLSADLAESSTVVIPSTVSIKGINYTVVAISDSAFAGNETVQTVVLPNHDVMYSSAAFASCTSLGTIQYNDVLPFSENAENTVASLPVASAQSLIENSNDDESED